MHLVALQLHARIHMTEEVTSWGGFPPQTAHSVHPSMPRERGVKVSHVDAMYKWCNDLAMNMRRGA